MIAKIKERQNVIFIKGASDQLVLAKLLMLVKIFQGHLLSTASELAFVSHTLEQPGSEQGYVVAQDSLAGGAIRVTRVSNGIVAVQI